MNSRPRLASINSSCSTGLPILAAAAVLALLLFPAAQASAQAVDPNFPITDVDVLSSALDGRTLYVAGSFNYVGPFNGPFACVDSSNGAAVGPHAFADGPIYAAAPDGQGGWFIGGQFQHVSGVPRLRLAHVRQDGSLDGWNPSPDGDVLVLARIGQEVYVGGKFANIGGQARVCLAELDAASGFATGWNPSLTGSSPEVDALTNVGDTLLVAGLFTSIGGVSHGNLAAVDLSTRIPTPWNPAPDNVVQRMCVAGSKLYVSGGFYNIGGQPRFYAGAFDLSTGLLAAWIPNPNAAIYALAASGNTVYVGGQFTHIGGQSRSWVAALDGTTGLATSWNPNASDIVNAIAVSGSTVYISGGFRVAGGQPRSCVAAVDATTGLATPWNPSTDAPPQVLLSAGSSVLVAGTFSMLGAVARAGLAAIDLGTDAITPWNPTPDGTTFVVAAHNGVVYTAGAFTHIGGQPRQVVAAVDSASGLATSWNPTVTGSNPVVSTLACADSVVYLGGRFTTVAGSPRNSVAALSAATGVLSTWDPEPNSTIDNLAIDGSTIYATGGFTSIGGSAHAFAAALDPTSGVASAWDAGLTNSVGAVLPFGGWLYLCGGFTSAGGAPRNYLAAVDSVTGTATAWNPFPNTGGVYPLAQSGGEIYMGTFDFAGGANLVEADAATGSVSPWNAPIAREYPLTYPILNGLAADDSRVYVGGRFGGVCGRPLHDLAAVETSVPGPLGAAVVWPNGGETLVVGEQCSLQWTDTAPHGAQSVDLYLSRAGSAGPWELIAAGVTNPGNYSWTITGPESNALCYLRVDARDWFGNSISAMSSGAFSISASPAAVGGPPVETSFALATPTPNPTRGTAMLSFAVPVAGSVRLGLLDVQGREIQPLVSGWHDAGRYSIPIRTTGLAPGLYFVRLRAESVTLSRRFLVVR